MDKKPGGRGRGSRKPKPEEINARGYTGDKELSEIETREFAAPAEYLLSSASKPDTPNREALASEQLEPDQTLSGHSKCSEKSNQQCKQKDLMDDVPKTKIEAADEFRLDAVLSSDPVALHFFCCVCGSPAGHDCFTCEERGHPVCKLCQCDLNLEECPYAIARQNKNFKCSSPLVQVKSSFREFMFKNTIVGCLSRKSGCKFEGPWEEVEKHQDECEYSGK